MRWSKRKKELDDLTFLITIRDIIRDTTKENEIRKNKSVTLKDLVLILEKKNYNCDEDMLWAKSVKYELKSIEENLLGCLILSVGMSLSIGGSIEETIQILKNEKNKQNREILSFRLNILVKILAIIGGGYALYELILLII